MSRLGYVGDIEDARDVLFGLPDLVSIPQAHSLRSHIGRIYDQGPTNSCVAQALAQALLVEQHGHGHSAPELSRLWIYWHARAAGRVEGDAGSRIRDAIRALRDLGCPPEADFAFDVARVSRPPGWFLSRAAHDFRGIRRYRRARTPDEIRAAIASGAPVVGGWQVDRPFLEDDGPREVRSMDGPIAGGHALCLVGYDGEWFEVVNSWGSSWRDAGTCLFHESVVAQVGDAWAIDTGE